MIYYQVILTVHQSRYENLPISSSLHRNNMPKVSHYNTVITLFEICTPEIYEMFVYKHKQTIEHVKKSSLLVKKNANFTG